MFANIKKLFNFILALLSLCFVVTSCGKGSIGQKEGKLADETKPKVLPPPPPIVFAKETLEGFWSVEPTGTLFPKTTPYVQAFGGGALIINGNGFLCAYEHLADDDGTNKTILLSPEDKEHSYKIQEDKIEKDKLININPVLSTAPYFISLSASDTINIYEDDKSKNILASLKQIKAADPQSTYNLPSETDSFWAKIINNGTIDVTKSIAFKSETKSCMKLFNDKIHAK